MDCLTVVWAARASGSRWDARRGFSFADNSSARRTGCLMAPQKLIQHCRRSPEASLETESIPAANRSTLWAVCIAAKCGWTLRSSSSEWIRCLLPPSPVVQSWKGFGLPTSVFFGNASMLLAPTNSEQTRFLYSAHFVVVIRCWFFICSAMSCSKNWNSRAPTVSGWA